MHVCCSEKKKRKEKNECFSISIVREKNLQKGKRKKGKEKRNGVVFAFHAKCVRTCVWDPVHFGTLLLLFIPCDHGDSLFLFKLIQQ